VQKNGILHLPNVLLFDDKLILYDFKSIEIFLVQHVWPARNNRRDRPSAANQIIAEKAGGGLHPMS
jgi:hypothetical protein